MDEPVSPRCRVLFTWLVQSHRTIEAENKVMVAWGWGCGGGAGDDENMNYRVVIIAFCGFIKNPLNCTFSEDKFYDM